MYKMVVCDFFGTLINSEEAIPLSTMIELDRIRKEGIIFCIVTSKSLKVVAEYNRDFPFIDYIVAFNGSYVYDMNKHKVIYDKGLNATKFKKICKLFEKRDMCFYTLDACNYTGKYRDNDYSEMVFDVDEFIEEKKNDIYKVKVFFEERQALNEAVKLLENDDKLSYYVKKQGHVWVLEIYNGLNSKFTGIKKILDRRKLKLEDVLTICSSESSYLLAKKSGNCYVMENGDIRLKKIVKNLTSSNEEKGVEKVIKKNFKSA